ncbi:hypothetical protein D9615_002888 [Tricholomella constricta]|uniref:Uncharacterized protein n=1 Tax=Tricholomella constricta TaxID=117010 RepID=A0A8H5HFS1_9AGAR|nr:hypothetical protein D9615_002888 [Tricholomella constricta]
MQPCLTQYITSDGYLQELSRFSSWHPDVTMQLSLTSALFFLPLACAPLAQAASKSNAGTIVSPRVGSTIAAGSTFEFYYQTRADYSISSYNFTVWLFTSPPKVTATSELFTTGYFFGRFSEPNYPGNPNPHNEPPSEFTMPDFLKSLGGFGEGSGVKKMQVHLAVLEEYGTGIDQLGFEHNNLHRSVGS